MLGYLIFAVHNLLSLAMMWYAANHCLELRFSRRATIALEAGGLALCALVGCLSELLPLLDAVRPFAIMAIFFSLADPLSEQALSEAARHALHLCLGHCGGAHYLFGAAVRLN